MLRNLLSGFATLMLAACVGSPSSPVLTIDPVAPKTDAELYLRFTSPWVTLGAPPPEVTVAWTRDGVGVPAFQDLDSIPADETSRGQVWAATMSRRDGMGEPVIASVVIANSAPVVSTVHVYAAEDIEDVGDNPISSYSVSPGTPLGCHVGEFTDADLDSVVGLYAWTVDGEILPNQVGEFLNGEQVVAGGAVGCIVTPNDGIDSGEPIRSEQVRVNQPPRIDSVELVVVSADGSDGLDAPFADSMLEVEFTVSDPDQGDTLETTVEWAINGAPVAGVTGTLLADEFLRGDEVSVSVIVCDDRDLCAPEWSEALTIQNSPPEAGTPTLTELVPGVEGWFKCHAPADFYDLDDDEEGWLYLWTVDGEPIADVDASLNVAKIEFDDERLPMRGMPVVCSVAPFDGMEEGAWADSEPKSVANTAPVGSAPSVRVLDRATSEPTEASPFRDSLVACATGAGIDVDGDSLTWRYQWYLGGTLRTETESELDLATVEEAARGDKLSCRTAPFDGALEGSWLSSEILTVANSPPSTPTVSITPRMPYPNESLTCTVVVKSVDVDGDVVTYSFSWMLNGRPYSGATSGSLTSAVDKKRIEKGQEWLCKAVAQDGRGAASSSIGVSVTVLSRDDAVCSDGFATAQEGSSSGQNKWAARCETASANGHEAIFLVENGPSANIYVRGAGTGSWGAATTLVSDVGPHLVGACSVEQTGSGLSYGNFFYDVDPSMDLLARRNRSTGVSFLTTEPGKPDALVIFQPPPYGRPRVLLHVLSDPASSAGGRCWKYRDWISDAFVSRFGDISSCILDFNPSDPSLVRKADFDRGGVDKILFTDGREIRVVDLDGLEGGTYGVEAEFDSIETGCSSDILSFEVFDLDSDGEQDIHLVCGGEVITLFGDGEGGVRQECGEDLPETVCVPADPDAETTASQCSNGVPFDRDEDGLLDLFSSYHLAAESEARQLYYQGL